MERWFRSGLGAREVSIYGLRALFVIAFVALGVAGIERFHLPSRLGDEPGASAHAITRDATSDEYFRALLEAHGIPRASIVGPTSKLRSVLSTMNGTGPIVFVAPRSLPEFEVAYQLVRTISLPRRVVSAYCDSPNGTWSDAVPVSAYVLYLIDPPPNAQNALSLAPKLTVIVSSEVSSWTTFCSR